MYMTRLELDRSRRETVLAMSTPSRFHGAIEAGYPGERRRRLWRIDELNGRSYLLIVSEDQPDLSAAAAQFSPPGARWETRAYDGLLASIVPGSRWHFRLTANPTVSAPSSGGERGRVYAHVTVQQQKDWLLKRAEAHGFQLTESSFDVTQRRTLTFRKGSERRPVTLGTCVFEGVLTVTDPALFRQTLTDGMGRGKAYGQGMMTVVRERASAGEG